MDLAVKNTPLENKYRQGDSFLADFLKLTRPWSRKIKVYPGNLCTAIWNGNQIEFLVIDAMKNWELANAIVKGFYPYLIPGKSFILHQDFAHWYTSWIHLLQYRFREYFQMVYDIPESPGIVFQYVRPIPSQLLQAEYSSDSFNRAEIEQAFEYSLAASNDNQKRANIASSKVMMFVHMNDIDRAESELKRFLDQGLPLTYDMQTVADQIQEAR
jgi:hypothetical protein